MQCPVGYTLLQSTCYKNCPSGTTVSNDDATVCVSTIECPGNSEQDLVFDAVCNKTGTPIDSGCAPGLYEWTPGVCYINCMAPFIESGLTCRKRTLSREFVRPTCNSWFLWYLDSNCSLNPLSLFFVIFVVFVVAYLVFLSTRRPKTVQHVLPRQPLAMSRSLVDPKRASPKRQTQLHLIKS